MNQGWLKVAEPGGESEMKKGVAHFGLADQATTLIPKGRRQYGQRVSSRHMHVWYFDKTQSLKYRARPLCPIVPNETQKSISKIHDIHHHHSPAI